METTNDDKTQTFSQHTRQHEEGGNDRRYSHATYSKSLMCLGKEKKDYIVKLVTLLFLRGMKFKEFYLGCNIEGTQMFGDISFAFVNEKDSENEVWLMHVHNPQQSVFTFNLLDSQSHLCLLACLNDINAIRNNFTSCKHLQTLGSYEDINFILYTGGTISETSTCRHLNPCPNFLLLENNSASVINSNYDTSQPLKFLEELEMYNEFLEYLNSVENTSESFEKLQHLITHIHTTEIKKKLETYKKNPVQEILSVLSSEVKHFQSVSSYANLLPKFHVYTGQQKMEEISNLIKSEIFHIRNVNDFGMHIAYQYLLKEIEEWCTSHNYFLNKDSALWKHFNTVLENCSKIQKSCMESISKTNIKFFAFPTKKMKSNVLKHKVVNIVANSHDISLSCLKVFQILEDIAAQKYLWVTFKTLLQWKNDVLHMWFSDTFSTLVVEYESSNEDYTGIANELGCILKTYTRKCLIIISSETDAFTCSLKNAVFADDYCELKDNFRFIDLDDQSQLRVLNKGVLFQGELISIRSLIGTNDDLMRGLSASVVSQLMHETTSVAIGPLLHESVNNFIPRALEFLVDLDVNILKSATQTEVFVVSGITVNTLQKIVANDDIELYSSGNSEINSESRLFCLIGGDLEEQFITICDHFSFKNVHHLLFKNGSLWWRQSKGQTKYLKDYLNMNENARHIWEVIEKCTTNMFTPKTLLDSVEHHTIILGESGMGKSTFLTSLQKNTKKEAPLHWLIHLNFNNDIKLIVKTKKEDYDCEVIIQIMYSLLKNEHHATELEHIIFRHDFEKRGNVIIICEGIENVNTAHLKKVLEFLQALETMKIKKVWIASKLNMKSILEQSFRVVCSEMLPLTFDDQKTLLHSLWADHLKNYEYEQIQEFVKSVQIKYGNVKPSLLGFPIMCFMFAKIFEMQILEYIASSQVNWPENVDAVQIYDIFIQMKRSGNEKSNIDLNITFDTHDEKEDFCMNRHMLCALFSLLDIPDLSQLGLLDVFENVSKFVNEVRKFGIIVNIVNKKPIFLHRTFAEYFAAMWFSKNIEKSREFLRNKMFASNFIPIMRFFDYFVIKGHELHMAVLKGDVQSVESLLAYGVDSNSVDKVGRTALHLAIIYSQPRISTLSTKSSGDTHDCITELLVSHSVNKKMIDNVLLWRPVQYAIELKKWDAIDLLVKEQINFNDLDCLKEKMKEELFVQEGLRIGSENGYFSLLECFFCCGINISENVIQTKEGAYSPLHIAAKYGQLKLVRFLLSKRVKISMKDSRGVSPLHLAASEGMSDVLVYLLQRGADLFCTDRDGNTPLHFAILKGNLHMIILLIEQYHSNINSQNKFGDTPLHHAVKVGHVNVIEYILMKGAQIDICNRDGNTALHLAVWLEMLSVVKVLLEYAANVNICNKNGDTPLNQNAGGGHLEIAKILVESGADINKMSDDGNTALHWAARQNNESLVEYLISKGADINAQNKYGNTPLHRAVEHGCLATTKCLINGGCNIKLQNNAGYTSVNIRSRSKEVTECVSCL